MRRPTRRQAFYSLASLATATLADAFLLEPRWLQVSTRRVPLFSGKANRPIRLAHLSDLHLSSDVSPAMIERSFRQTIELAPDLVCITGDFITHGYGQDLSAYPALLQILSSRFPTFAVKGNHDGGAWAREFLGEPLEGVLEPLLAQANVQLLHNRSQLQRLHGLEFFLAGIGDIWSDEDQPALAFAPIPPRETTILLAHNPDSKDQVRNYSWRLMLSGHTHGTQNGIPYLHEHYAPVEDKRFIAGLCRWPEAPGGERLVHVSKGVGNIGGFRIFCPPEVTLLELV